MNTRKIIKKLLLMISFALPFSQANALVLDNWNVTELNNSGDYIDVTFGSDWFSLQWEAGSNNGLQALGLDTVFYNSPLTVSSVFTGGNAGAMTDDVTNDWNLNFGGTNGGGGFGNFLSRKNLDGGGTDGISNFITFLLSSDFTNPFPQNADGATMDVHVRYEQSCSGWVSDGNSDSVGSDSSCGGGSVPEPTPLVLLAIGLGLLGLSRKVWALTRT
jgi:hypothetical protein